MYDTRRPFIESCLYRLIAETALLFSAYDAFKCVQEGEYFIITIQSPLSHRCNHQPRHDTIDDVDDDVEEGEEESDYG